MLNPQALNQLLALYAWFPLAASLMILLLIARFYEKFSGKKMYFRAFFVPLVLFGAAEVRYAHVGRVVGDVLGDLAYAGAGITLILLCSVIYLRMLSPASYHAPEEEIQAMPAMPPYTPRSAPMTHKRKTDHDEPE